MQQAFTHLRLHSEFSIVDGIVRIKPLISELVAKGMNAVAITDYSNLFAVVKFYKAAISLRIKPILGCEFPCIEAEYPTEVTSLILLSQNEEGYRNLTCL